MTNSVDEAAVSGVDEAAFVEEVAGAVGETGAVVVKTAGGC